jgi:hypothetical protein
VARSLGRRRVQRKRKSVAAVWIRVQKWDTLDSNGRVNGSPEINGLAVGV